MKIFGKEFKKEKLFKIYWFFDQCQGRGSGYLNELRLTTYIPVAGALFIIFPSLLEHKMILAPLIVLVFFIGTFTLGLIDLKYIRYWHYDNEMNATFEMNPRDRRIERRLIKIEKALKVKSEPTPFDISETKFEKEIKR